MVEAPPGGVRRREASVADVDVTGVTGVTVVRAVGTHVADVLMQAAQSVRLSGASVLTRRGCDERE